MQIEVAGVALAPNVGFGPGHSGCQPVNASVSARLGQGELGSLGGKIWLGVHGVVGLALTGLD
jgi:hypothetical protein